jgi:hypothetical protein
MWSDDADATLQDCFASTDWNMFLDSSNGIKEYTGFINKCIDDIVPTVTVRIYHNQKPLITVNIRTDLELPLSRRRTLIRMLIRNPAMIGRRTIKQAKLQYRTKIEYDARWMWQRLQTILDYKGKPSRELPMTRAYEMS